MMYASKIIIDRNPKKLNYVRAVKLPEALLTISDISKHIKENEKFIFEEDGDITILKIYGFRFESESELKIRIEKEEKYNENYDKFHLNIGRF